MPVNQIMQKDFGTIQQHESIQAAASKMREKQVPILLVLDEENVRGILTEKEILKALSEGQAPAANTASPAASDEQRCCYFNDVQVELLLAR